MKRIKLLVLLFLMMISTVFAQEKKYKTYTVQKGETLYHISKKFAVTPYDLLQLNPDIKDNIISEGQILIVPNKDYTPTEETFRGDYVKDGFLYHKVLPQENYYRLKKQFKASKRDLRKYNPELRTGDLKAGQIIRIPAGDLENTVVQQQSNVFDTKPYLVRPKETKFSIARRYGITVERLEELNPHLKDNNLKIAEIIKVPNTEEIPDNNINYNAYAVLKGETLYSLSKKFNLPQGQLILLNPALSEGVKEGMILTIPENTLVVNTLAFEANIPLDRKLNVSMLLPLSTEKETIDFKKDKTLDIVTDFYLGALMALDSLKKQGLSVNLKVFDTQNKNSIIASIIQQNNLRDEDLLIGPMFLDNVKFVSQFMRSDSLAIISPVSAKDHSVFASKNIVQDVPSDVIVSEKMMNYISNNYKGQHLVAITDTIKANTLRYAKLIARLNSLDSIGTVSVLKPEKGYIRPDRFKNALLPDVENWVILLAEDEVVTLDVVNNLGVIPDKMNITLFTLYDKPYFSKVNNSFLARLNFHFPTTYFVDYENDDTRKFIDKYMATNFAVPGEYAFKGFDIVYDALIRLATYPNYRNAFSNGYSERYGTKFLYPFSTSYLENQGVFLVKYDGLNLLKIEE
ncbi:MAG: LysM peptidoglycan-binding domain-containing protein [Flavobacteriaceae bacterium]|nr:LysM peptidoglycan-binding domain-containing protein [Flavobacteriaceae bacterium]